MTSAQDSKFLSVHNLTKKDQSKVGQQQTSPYLSPISRSTTSLRPKTPLKSQKSMNQKSKNNPVFNTNEKKLNKSLTIMHRLSTSCLDSTPSAAQRRKSSLLKVEILKPKKASINKSLTIMNHSNSSYLEPTPKAPKRRVSSLLKTDALKANKNDYYLGSTFDWILQLLKEKTAKTKKRHEEINPNELILWAFNEIITRLPFLELFKVLKDSFLSISSENENTPQVLKLKQQIKSLESEISKLKSSNSLIESKLKTLSEENIKYSNQAEELNREVKNWRAVKDKGIDFSKGSVEAKLILDENEKKGEMIRELTAEVDELTLKVAKLTSTLCLVEQQGGITTKVLQEFKDQANKDMNGRRGSMAVFVPALLLSSGQIKEESKELECLKNIDMLLSDDLFMQKRISPVPALKLEEIKQVAED
ncbi:unnamed protein product [Blepharisma stoltei]|uniref:Translin-associated factor X-interacting protein 1 N-terminal domain-containing protein n=1 Tax=Blepharisma stoltei TaxID=1481888 RepID=A0AAU9KFK6_9CILI|nr:unnamed protein product [Blepharisma stoltei]